VQKYTHTFENEMNEPCFPKKHVGANRSENVRKALRSWYLQHARPLPWRKEPSTYGTWLSEIMLQQTRVDTGIPKWHAFRETFPTVRDLAMATEDEVLKAWEGLGYYRRAKLLHRAAQTIHASGRYPRSHKEWLEIPGVGPYTAAAISSIALGEAVAAVDGNVQRVVARWDAIDLAVDSKDGAKAIQSTADSWLDHDHPGDHNQAVMELGALICTPKKPQCGHCPISNTCASADNDDLHQSLPVKKPKKKAEAWALTLHVAVHGDKVAVVQRPETGIWASLWSLPETPPPSSFSRLGTLGHPVTHLLTHKRIEATFEGWQSASPEDLRDFAQHVGGEVLDWDAFAGLARPRLLTKAWEDLLRVLRQDQM